jgi:hypothetical protein
MQTIAAAMAIRGRQHGPTDMLLSYGRLLLRNKISHYKK